MINKKIKVGPFKGLQTIQEPGASLYYFYTSVYYQEGLFITCVKYVSYVKHWFSVCQCFTPLTSEIPESFLIAFDQESLDEIAVARKSKSLLESFNRDGVL